MNSFFQESLSVSGIVSRIVLGTVSETVSKTVSETVSKTVSGTGRVSETVTGTVSKIVQEQYKTVKQKLPYDDMNCPRNSFRNSIRSDRITNTIKSLVSIFMENTKGFLVPLLFAPLIGIEKICKWDAVVIRPKVPGLHSGTRFSWLWSEKPIWLQIKDQEEL